MKVFRAIGSLLIGIFTWIVLFTDRLITAPFVGIDQPGIHSLTNPQQMHNRAKSKYYSKVAKRILAASTIYGSYYLYNLIF